MKITNVWEVNASTAGATATGSIPAMGYALTITLDEEAKCIRIRNRSERTKKFRIFARTRLALCVFRVGS